MKHTIPHSLDPKVALKVAEHAFNSYVERFKENSPSVRWKGNTADLTFNAKGVTLTGSFAVLPRAFEVDLTVPLVLRLFQGQAVKVIEEEVQRWVQKAKEGAL